MDTRLFVSALATEDELLHLWKAEAGAAAMEGLAAGERAPPVAAGERAPPVGSAEAGAAATGGLATRGAVQVLASP